MVLKYFQSKLLKLIYEKHKICVNNTLVIYEDTRGKTKYKLCKNTTDKEFTYNGLNHYILAIRKFYINGFYSEKTIGIKYYDFRIKKRKVDFLEIVDKLIKLFD